jgi:hypothetical protein
MQHRPQTAGQPAGQPAHLEWQGTFERDTVTFRFADLARTLLAGSLSDPEVRRAMDDWLNRPPAAGNGEDGYLGIIDWDFGEDGRVLLVASRMPGEFVLSCQAEMFEAVLTVMFDDGPMDISLVSVTGFKGDPAIAIDWAMNLQAHLEEAEDEDDDEAP